MKDLFIKINCVLYLSVKRVDKEAPVPGLTCLPVRALGARLRPTTELEGKDFKSPVPIPPPSEISELLVTGLSEDKRNSGL